MCAETTRRERTKARHLRLRNKVREKRRRGDPNKNWGRRPERVDQPNSPLTPPPRQVSGSNERPRLAVFRSNNHIYAQVRKREEDVEREGRGDRRDADQSTYPPHAPLFSFQVIDDTKGNTLVSASTLTPEIREALGGAPGANVAAAAMVGAHVAKLCKAANIEKVAFDRGGFMYHGRVQALADAAREGGLNF